jgi:hypothetical protein
VDLYHWTYGTNVARILAHGFRESTYHSGGRGVHLCNKAGNLHRPIAKDQASLIVTFPDGDDLSKWLNTIQFPDCVDYVFPAETIGERATIRSDDPWFASS